MVHRLLSSGGCRRQALQKIVRRHTGQTGQHKVSLAHTLDWTKAHRIHPGSMRCSCGSMACLPAQQLFVDPQVVLGHAASREVLLKDLATAGAADGRHPRYSLYSFCHVLNDPPCDSRLKHFRHRT
ncbi:MAG TPA: hypothetical protein VI542_33550, partial [Candidatus Tectomicrobia bacterium]